MTINTVTFVCTITGC